MNWSSYIESFKHYLSLERSLSGNTIAAYLRDIDKFSEYLANVAPELLLSGITTKHCEEFLQSLGKIGISIPSQARILSGLKAFFKYLVLEGVVPKSPVELIEAPRYNRKLPVVLSVAEIEKMLESFDQSLPEGVRNKAILETLYASGLRVSEVINLKLSELYFDVGFIRVIGKGNKERIVPINGSAMKQIMIYVEEIRRLGKIKEGKEDFVFLNRRGSPLSRVMVFYVVKQAAENAGVNKEVSPHTFRHSFATHLYERGADLRAIQDMLGHESITTTEIYSQVNNQYLRDAMIQFHPRFGK